MIKTIDTRNITDIMLEAQNVIDGTTTYSDPLSFKDAADIFIAMAEAAPAVEPAMLNTCLSNAKQEESGWLRAIDEALVMHDVGVANATDTYEQAKDKLNKLLCVVQDIGAYFAKQEPAQAVEPLDAPHPDYAEYITFEGSTRIVISPDDYEQLYNAATRRAPPAIDDETKRMMLGCLVNGGV